MRVSDHSTVRRSELEAYILERKLVGDFMCCDGWVAVELEDEKLSDVCDLIWFLAPPYARVSIVDQDYKINVLFYLLKKHLQIRGQ